MRLFILGSTTEDQGNQLETLTRDILESLGYTQVTTVTNLAGEIDVVGKHITPMPMGNKEEKMIGECKARRDALNMTDWLKFLGKLYIEQASGATVNGCLIALSGVNGVVQGSFDALKLNNVQLVTSTSLIQYLSKIHTLADQAALYEFLRTHTDLTHSSVDLAYYERRVCWVIRYDTGRYTLLEGDLTYPSADRLNLIRPLIEAGVEASTFIDLRDEAAAKHLRLLSRKSVIAALMHANGAASREALWDGMSTWQRDVGVTTDSLYAAVDELRQTGVLTVTERGEVAFAADVESNTKVRYSVFAEYFREWMIPEGMGSEWWDRHIDGTLLAFVSEIQKGLRLSPEDQAQAIQIMRLSPTALAYALNADPMITTHRDGEQSSAQDKDVDEHDRLHFMRSLYNHLSTDFRRPEFAKYFFSVRRIDALLRNMDVTLKDRDLNIVISGSVSESNLIGEMDKKNAAGDPIYVHVSALPNYEERKREAAQRRAAKETGERAAAASASASSSTGAEAAPQ